MDLKKQEYWLKEKENFEKKNVWVGKVEKLIKDLCSSRATGITRSQQGLCKDKAPSNTINSIYPVSNRMQSCYIKTIISKRKENLSPRYQADFSFAYDLKGNMKINSDKFRRIK